MIEWWWTEVRDCSVKCFRKQKNEKMLCTLQCCETSKSRILMKNTQSRSWFLMTYKRRQNKCKNFDSSRENERKENWHTLKRFKLLLKNEKKCVTKLSNTNDLFSTLPFELLFELLFDDTLYVFCEDNANRRTSEEDATARDDRKMIIHRQCFLNQFLLNWWSSEAGRNQMNLNARSGDLCLTGIRSIVLHRKEWWQTVFWRECQKTRELYWRSVRTV